MLRIVENENDVNPEARMSLDAFIDLVVLMDVEGIVLRASASCARLLGY